MKIEFLYPELTMYGDSFNIKYLAMCNKRIEVIYTPINKKPYFVSHNVDMVYLGSLSESSQIAVINKLMPYKDRINELIKDDKIFLVTGSAMEIFGKSIKRNNQIIKCLNIFCYETEYDYSNRYHDLYEGEYEDIKIIGFKCQYTTINNVIEKPLFNTTKGMGNSKNSKDEGIRYRNFMASEVLGPLLIYNPLMIKKILKMLYLKQDLKFEKDVMESYENKLKGYN